MLFKSHTAIFLSVFVVSALVIGDSSVWGEWNLNPLRGRNRPAASDEEPLITDVRLASAESSITEQLDRQTEEAKSAVQRWNDGTKRFLTKTKDVLTPPKLLPFDSLGSPLSKREKPLTTAADKREPGRFGLPAWLSGPAKPEPLNSKPSSVNDFLALPRPE